VGREPASLFLYDAHSLSARSVLEAVYDGPFDLRSYAPQPVILERMPSLENGDVLIQPVQVQPGAAMVDADGRPAALAEGVAYRPSGCSEPACARLYSGSQPVEMDQLVVRFELLPALKWSDGAALTADDSLFSYEVARSLYPGAQPERVERTQSYQVLGETTVEWAGLPGDLGGAIQDKFFIPLPRHAWSLYPAQDLPGLDLAARTPLGWGPYVIDEWVAGDHITLHRNPFYFRAAEGLPH
jgi:peptide/nickel transport system substrate-binding protein